MAITAGGGGGGCGEGGILLYGEFSHDIFFGEGGRGNTGI